MVSNTTKPMVMTAAGVEDLEVMWKIASAFRGGAEQLREKPYFIQYGEPVSPLQHAPEVLDKLLFCADWGIPLIYSPAPIAGATAPITHAGHIVQAVAESLFGVVIHQLRRPGSPLLTGMGPVKLDMNTVQALYNSAEYYTTVPRHHRDGQVDGHPQLGLRRHQRLAVRRRQRRHRHHRAHAALHAGRLQPQPRHRLPRLRPHRRRRARRAHRRGHLDEPARARGHRGQRGDAGARHHRRGRPGRRLPRPEAHQAARARACSGGRRSSTAARRRTGRPTARPTPPRRRTASSSTS